MQWIGRRKRNRPFRDKTKSHNKVRHTGRTFLLSKFLFEQQRAESDGNGGNHTADHNRSHDAGRNGLTGSPGKGSSAEHIGRFIDRPAKVNRHHAAQYKSQNHFAGRRHTGQYTRQPFVEHSRRRVDDVRHNNSHQQQSQHRIQQHRLGSFQGLRQAGQHFFKPIHQIPGNKAGKQSAEEPGAPVHRQEAAYHTGHQCRTLADTHGDVTCQNRHHHTEGKAANVFQESCQRGTGTEVSRARISHIKQERQGNEDAAANHERQHVGHTVHQMFIDLTAYAFPLCRRGSRFIRGRTLSAKDRSFPLQNSIDQIFRFFDSCGHFYKQNFFPGKPLHRNILVTGHDNSCSSFNISRRQSVFHAAGSVGLNFNIYPHSSGFPLQGFCRHIGMGNTGRTGRHSSHKRFAGVCRCPGSSCCNTRCPCTCSFGTLAGSSCFFRSRCSLFRLRLFSFLFCFRFFLLYLDFLRLINDMEIFFRRLGVHQRFVELIVHQHPAAAIRKNRNAGSSSRLS